MQPAGCRIRRDRDLVARGPARPTRGPAARTIARAGCTDVLVARGARLRTDRLLDEQRQRVRVDERRIDRPFPAVDGHHESSVDAMDVDLPETPVDLDFVLHD